MNRYKVGVLCFLCFFLFLIGFVEAQKNKELELLGKVVYLDPGHGRTCLA